MKMNLMDADGVALPNYIATWNNDTQSIANSDGTIYFAGIRPGKADTIKIFDADKKQRGVCNIVFDESNITTIASVGTGGVYDVNYKSGRPDVYINTVVDKKGGADTLLALKQASEEPLPPGKAAKPVQPTKDPSGHDKPQEMAQDPCFNGYLIDINGRPIVGATVSNMNNESKTKLSATTDDRGYFDIAGISKGSHTISVSGADGAELAKADVTVVFGNKTDLVKTGNAITFNIKKGEAEVYSILQDYGNGKLEVLSLTDSDVAPPVIPGETQTPAPSQTVEPTSSASTEASSEIITPEPQDTPAAQDGMNTTLIVILIIVVAAAVVLAILLIRKSRQI